MHKFTLTAGHKIVKEQLGQWASILKPELYTKLEAHVNEHNKTIKDPYQLFRGSDIDNYVHNYLMSKR